MTITALIDADILCYQAALGAETPIKWDDDLWTLHAYESDAERSFDRLLEKIAEAVEATDVILAISDDANWRKEVLPTYKSNRSDTRKPMLLKHLKERCLSEFTAFKRSRLEGDDCLGILATMGKYQNPVICSLDKDFKTIPGQHFNFGKDKQFVISEAEADYWHMHQTLTGDTTDGYSGCPGIGPKTATNILSPFLYETKDGPLFAADEAWAAVLATYAKAGLGDEEALTQARVARICRSVDYDFKKKEPILWCPPT